MSDFTIDQIIKRFVELRDEVKADEKAAKSAVADKKEKLKLLTAWLQNYLITEKADSVKTEPGTVYRKQNTYYNVDNWDVFIEWAVANGRLDILKKDISSTKVAEMVEAGDPVPPGLRSYSEFEIGVRKS